MAIRTSPDARPTGAVIVIEPTEDEFSADADDAT
jgi:hypothetical protein